MNNQLKLGSCYEKSIGTSKGKKKAADGGNSVGQIGSNSGGQNETCNEATQKWNKIKTKNALEIDDIIKKYLNTSFNLYNIQTVKSRYIPKETLEPSLPTIHPVEPVLK
ncbi:14448_t:CDS:2, partial [Dentiscutata erythropus]